MASAPRARTSPQPEGREVHTVDTHGARGLELDEAEEGDGYGALAATRPVDNARMLPGAPTAGTWGPAAASRRSGLWSGHRDLGPRASRFGRTGR